MSRKKRNWIGAHHPGLKNIQQYDIIVSRYSTLVAEDIFPYIYVYIYFSEYLFIFLNCWWLKNPVVIAACKEPFANYELQFFSLSARETCEAEL
jgi:hypothetical protein